MKAGIVGLPNVGKSTLFNCLSNAKAQSANFPFPAYDHAAITDIRLQFPHLSPNPLIVP
mgnify:CR=1 FL=1